MMVFKLLFFCFQLHSVISLFHSGETQPFEVSLIKNLLVDEKELSPEHLSTAGPKVVHVQFTAFNGHHFFMNITLYEQNVHPDAPDDLKRHWSYKGEAWINHWLPGVASLQFHADHIKSYFTGLLIIDGIQYRIQPAHRHNDEDLPHNSGMAISRLGHFDDEKLIKPADFDHKEKEMMRRRLTIQKFSNCFDGQGTKTLVVKIGYIIDNSFKMKVLEEMEKDTGTNKEKLLRYIDQVNLDTNTIYHPQFDVHLSIISIRDQKATGAQGLDTIWANDADKSNVIARGDFNLDGTGRDACHRATIQEYLSEFQQWRQNTESSNVAGIWKLLTNCHPPAGTVGLAYVGAICGHAAAGVSNHMTPRYGGTWKVNAHEAGHIFGAGHSFDIGGGIMDYGDGKINGVFQFNQGRKGEVCGKIQQTLGQDPQRNFARPQCWTSMGTEGETYKWRKSTAGFGNSCGAPSFGKYRYKYVPWECEVYTKAGTKSVDASGVGCQATRKPFASQYDLPAECQDDQTTPVCGNGILEGDEECEPGLVGSLWDEDTERKLGLTESQVSSCCDAATCKWKEYHPALGEELNTNATSPQCVGSNNRIDAAFRRTDGSIYVFQDKKVYKFTDGEQLLTEDKDYPQLINTAFPGLDEALHDGIGAAAHKPGSDSVFFWQKRDNIGQQKYQQYDLKNRKSVGALKNMDGGIDDYVGGSGGEYGRNQWGKCNAGVEAALGTEDGVWLFCSNQVLVSDWGVVNGGQWGLNYGQEWGAASELPYQKLFESQKFKSHPSAAYWVGGDSTHARMINKGYALDWWMNANQNSKPKLVPGLGIREPEEDLGVSDRPDENGNEIKLTSRGCPETCLTCELTNNMYCVSCKEGYKPFGEGAVKTCVDQNVQIMIDFEDNSLTHSQLEGGKEAYENLNGRFAVGYGGSLKALRFENQAANLLSSNASSMALDNSVKLATISKKFLSMEITTWYKPNGAHEGTAQRLFTASNYNDNKIAAEILSFNALSASNVTGTDIEQNLPNFIRGTTGNGQLQIIFPRSGFCGKTCFNRFLGKLDPKLAYAIPCASRADILQDQWNEIRLRFDRSTLTCCVRGDCTKRMYMEEDNAHDMTTQTGTSGFTVNMLDFVVDTFTLGGGSSINGDIDNVEIKLWDTSTESSPKILIYVIACVLIVFGFGVLYYKKQVDCCNPCGAEGHGRETKTQMSSYQASYNPPKGPPAAPSSRSTEGQVKSTGTAGRKTGLPTRRPPPKRGNAPPPPSRTPIPRQTSGKKGFVKQASDSKQGSFKFGNQKQNTRKFGSNRAPPPPKKPLW